MSSTSKLDLTYDNTTCSSVSELPSITGSQLSDDSLFLVSSKDLKTDSGMSYMSKQITYDNLYSGLYEKIGIGDIKDAISYVSSAIYEISSIIPTQRGTLSVQSDDPYIISSVVFNFGDKEHTDSVISDLGVYILSSGMETEFKKYIFSKIQVLSIYTKLNDGNMYFLGDYLNDISNYISCLSDHISCLSDYISCLSDHLSGLSGVVNDLCSVLSSGTSTTSLIRWF